MTGASETESAMGGLCQPNVSEAKTTSTSCKWSFPVGGLKE